MDSPSVKTPFRVSLTVKEGLVALASGIPIQDPTKQNASPFIYEQHNPVPLYLFAIAAGNFKYSKIENS